MSALGLPILDQSVQAANIWLHEVGDVLGPNRQRAYHALRAVLHCLRDRLTVDEAAHLAAQMPLLIRGIYYEGWAPARTPVKYRSVEAFTEAVGQRLAGGPPMDAGEAIKAVFATLKKHCAAGEIDDVLAQLPADLKPLLAEA